MPYLEDEITYFNKMEVVKDVMRSFTDTYLISDCGVQFNQVLRLENKDLCLPNDDLLRIFKTGTYKLN